MQEIAHNIFIETGFPGVVSGFMKLRDGSVMVDVPYRLEDQHTWRNHLIEAGADGNKLLVMLDTHIERMLGLTYLHVNVLCQEQGIEIIQSRSTNIKGQDYGASEIQITSDLLVNLRCVLPDMSYSDRVAIYWDETPIVITHQPGAHLAGSWLWREDEKVLFVGDSVVIGQPPFLAFSNLEKWMDELDWLSSDYFNGWKIISGRNGWVKRRSINKMADFLAFTQDIVSKITPIEHLDEQITEAVHMLAKRFNTPQEMRDCYQNRLRWGLENYLQRQLNPKE